MKKKIFGVSDLKKKKFKCESNQNDAVLGKVKILKTTSFWKGSVNNSVNRKRKPNFWYMEKLECQGCFP